MRCKGKRSGEGGWGVLPAGCCLHSKGLPQTGFALARERADGYLGGDVTELPPLQGTLQG